jgi:hypothetical protein
MSKLNCWEYIRCGREPYGARVAELGVCPAAMERKADGFNGGKNAGRVCWAIANTLCGGKVQGSLVEKLTDCMECEFFKSVCEEEGFSFKGCHDVFLKLKSHE